MDAGWIVLIVIMVLLVGALAVVAYLVPLKAYFTALLSGCHVSCRMLISMHLRKLPVNDLIMAFVSSRKANLGITLEQIENLYSSNSNYGAIIDGLLLCKSANLNVNFETVRKIILSGKDIRQFVQDCLNSKVIETDWISGMCGDLQELRVKLKLTLGINMNNLSSTLDEKTILARVRECVVSRIIATASHTTLLQRPQYFAKTVYEAEVDNGNFYSVISAEITDVVLGDNLKSKREQELIEKQHQIEKNKVEMRRLTAVAVEQEMKAKTQEAKAKLTEKELEVPSAVVEAINNGKMDNLLDFYKIENIQADTEMRRRLVGQLSGDDDYDDD